VPRPPAFPHAATARRPGAARWPVSGGVLPALLTLLALVAAVVAPAPTAAHADLERAEPPPDGLLGVPPDTLELWLTETIDVGAGSPSVRLFDDAGIEQPLGLPLVARDDRRHLSVPIAGIGTGTFTVAWAIRSATDGHTLSGTYAFRVGTGRAPGAARVQGETPAPWGVATRWLTFLGVAVVAGGAGYARVVRRGAGGTGDEPRRRGALIAAGAVVALAATLAEPIALAISRAADDAARAAGSDSPSPSVVEVWQALPDAFAALPDAWWLRLAAIALLPVALLFARALRAHPRVTVPAEWATLALALVALLGLSLTSHAAARETWRPLALASNVLHQWSIALWVGGLAHLAVAWPGRRPAYAADDAVGSFVPASVSGGADGAEADPVRRFSRLALGLVTVGVGTGVLNSGLVLPRVSALWQTSYGTVLLLKLLALTPVLALATVHRAALRRAAGRFGGALLSGRALRAEAALALVVVLGGSVLTLLAPPGTRAGNGDLAMIDLAAPLPAGVVHLELQPAAPGDNAVVVRLDETALAVGGTPAVRVAFTPLDHTAADRTVEPRADATGRYAVAGVSLDGAGWWRAEVTVAPTGQPAVTVPFYLLLADPNVNGENAAPAPDAQPEARALFERALSTMTALHRVRFSQRLTDGQGALTLANLAMADGSDGRTPAFTYQAAGFEQVIVGDREWVRLPGREWTERPAAYLFQPARWGDAYATARGFRLGPGVEVDGVRARVVTFQTPAVAPSDGVNRQAGYWYAWWVSVDGGHVLREAMVSNRHYMLYRYGDFDAPLAIAPPVAEPPAATPVVQASPVATPPATPATAVL